MRSISTLKLEYPTGYLPSRIIPRTTAIHSYHPPTSRRSHSLRSMALGGWPRVLLDHVHPLLLPDLQLQRHPRPLVSLMCDPIRREMFAKNAIPRRDQRRCLPNPRRWYTPWPLVKLSSSLRHRATGVTTVTSIARHPTVHVPHQTNPPQNPPITHRVMTVAITIDRPLPVGRTQPTETLPAGESFI